MEVSELVFACHSKSCAPPPTGTGGSDPFEKIRDAVDYRIKINYNVNQKGPRHVARISRVLDDAPVAEITWNRKTGEIGNIEVEEEYRRKGIATALYHEVMKESGLRNWKPPKHSDWLTQDGEKWKASLREELSYSPSQARIPKGQKGGGRWADGASGVSQDNGHSLWIIDGVSSGATHAAAAITNANGWIHENNPDPWAVGIATNLLSDIQRQKVRTTPGFSGHSSTPWSDLKEGDVIDIPLMAITPVRKLAEMYQGADVYSPTRNAAFRNSEMERKLAPLLRDPDIKPSNFDFIKREFTKIDSRSFGIKDSKQHSPSTTFVFSSNKSAPIRPNERVASGRYRVTNVSRVTTPGHVLLDSENMRFVDAQHQVVTLNFVEDLPLTIPD